MLNVLLLVLTVLLTSLNQSFQNDGGVVHVSTDVFWSSIRRLTPRRRGWPTGHKTRVQETREGLQQTVVRLRLLQNRARHKVRDVSTAAPHLEDVDLVDVAEPRVRRLQVVERVPHVALGGEDDGFQAVGGVANLLRLAHLLEPQQDLWPCRCGRSPRVSEGAASDGEKTFSQKRTAGSSRDCQFVVGQHFSGGVGARHHQQRRQQHAQAMREVDW